MLLIHTLFTSFNVRVWINMHWNIWKSIYVYTSNFSFYSNLLEKLLLLYNHHHHVMLATRIIENISNNSSFSFICFRFLSFLSLSFSVSQICIISLNFRWNACCWWYCDWIKYIIHHKMMCCVSFNHLKYFRFIIYLLLCSFAFCNRKMLLWCQNELLKRQCVIGD